MEPTTDELVLELERQKDRATLWRLIASALGLLLGGTVVALIAQIFAV